MSVLLDVSEHGLLLWLVMLQILSCSRVYGVGCERLALVPRGVVSAGYCWFGLESDVVLNLCQEQRFSKTKLLETKSKAGRYKIAMMN